jgi:FeS assembly protein IscX
VKLTWQDVGEVAAALARRYPDTDPLTVSSSDLRRMVAELPEFGDVPSAATEDVLEDVQAAWYDEFEEH